MPSLTQDLAHTGTARWLREARQADPSAWKDRERCFEALARILDRWRSSRLGDRWSQPSVSPPHLLSDVARDARISRGSVYQRWTAAQNGRGITRWAGPDPGVAPREAFVAEAKIVSFWPCREGALAVADVFEMSLIEVAASYLRALGAWAADNPVLAACVPSGPPPCVGEDMRVLARRRFARSPAGRSGIDAAASKLKALAGDLVGAVLGDASMTPLGAFNVIRDQTLRLLSDPPDPVIVKAGNALSELADRLLYRRDGEQVLTVGQARQLQAEITSLSALLASAAGGHGGEIHEDPGEEADR